MSPPIVVVKHERPASRPFVSPHAAWRAAWWTRSFYDTTKSGGPLTIADRPPKCTGPALWGGPLAGRGRCPGEAVRGLPDRAQRVDAPVAVERVVPLRADVSRRAHEAAGDLVGLHRNGAVRVRLAEAADDQRGDARRVRRGHRGPVEREPLLPGDRGEDGGRVVAVAAVAAGGCNIHGAGAEVRVAGDRARRAERGDADH